MNNIDICTEIVCTEIRQKKTGVRHCFAKNIGEDSKYICPYMCEYKTKNESTMSMHISRKHGIVAGRQVDFFKCVNCVKTFNTGTALAHHNKTHELGSIGCPKCDMKFKTDSSLCTHYVRAHMDEKSMIKFVDQGMVQCLCCEKVMKPASMTYHLAKCVAESPFSGLKQEKDRIALEESESKKYTKMVKDLAKQYAKIVDKELKIAKIEKKKNDKMVKELEKKSAKLLKSTVMFVWSV